MIRLNIVCEGQTEENFVKEILGPHLLMKGVVATPHNLGTGTQYARLRKKVVEWLKHEPGSWVTTLIDILKLIPNYNKPAFGMIVAKEIGLEKMREACPHFNEWMTRLENLGDGDIPVAE